MISNCLTVADIQSWNRRQPTFLAKRESRTFTGDGSSPRNRYMLALASNSSKFVPPPAHARLALTNLRHVLLRESPGR